MPTLFLIFRRDFMKNQEFLQCLREAGSALDDAVNRLSRCFIIANDQSIPETFYNQARSLQYDVYDYIEEVKGC